MRVESLRPLLAVPVFVAASLVSAAMLTPCVARGTPADLHVQATFGRDGQYDEGVWSWISVADKTVASGHTVSSIALVDYDVGCQAEVGFWENASGSRRFFSHWTVNWVDYQDDGPALAAPSWHSFAVRRTTDYIANYKWFLDGVAQHDGGVSGLYRGPALTNAEADDTVHDNWGHWWSLKYFDLSTYSWYASTRLYTYYDNDPQYKLGLHPYTEVYVGHI